MRTKARCADIDAQTCRKLGRTPSPPSCEERFGEGRTLLDSECASARHFAGCGLSAEHHDINQCDRTPTRDANKVPAACSMRAG